MTSQASIPAPANEDCPPFKVEQAIVTGGVPYDVGISANETWNVSLLTESGEEVSAVAKSVSQADITREIVASGAACVLGMPVPRIFLAADEIDLVPENKVKARWDGKAILLCSERKDVPPLSRRLHRQSKLPQQIIDLLAGWSHCGATLALDAWLANVDRHEGNLLFDGGGAVWLIDHERSFGGPGDIPPASAAEADYAHDMGQRWFCPRLHDAQMLKLMPAALKFCETMRGVDLSAVSGQVAEQLDGEPVDAMLSFLEARIEHASGLTLRATGMSGW